MSSVLEEQRGGALWVTINRPERRNALTDEVLGRIARAYERAESDSSVRVIVLTGMGDRAFCAGADLEVGRNFVFDRSSPSTAYGDLARVARGVQKPSIARVNGACMAGGMGLLGMTDLAVAVDSATFGLPEVRLGLFPMQAVALLQGFVTRRVLREWSLGGDRFDATEALRAGLVNVIAPASGIDAIVDRWVTALSRGSPAALRRGLWALRRMQDLDFDSALAFGEAQIRLAALTDEAKEGIAAFNEKRRPSWVVE